MITTTEWAATTGPRANDASPTDPTMGSNTREATRVDIGGTSTETSSEVWPCLSDALAGADGSFFSRPLARVLLGSQEGSSPPRRCFVKQVNF